MNMTRLLLPLLAAIVLFSARPALAQVDDTNPEAAPPAGSTVITSDALHSDQAAHTSIFTGKVVVTGTNFNMTCEEMTVYFDNSNKVTKIVAVGDVVITQPDRVTHCGHAEYYHDADTFVLTESPVIYDHKDKLEGTKITINRATQKLTTDGGRSKVTLDNENLGANTTSPTPAPGATNSK